MPPNQEGNGWNEHSRLVLSQLERHSNEIKEFVSKMEERYVETREAIQEIKTELSSMRTNTQTITDLMGRIQKLEVYREQQEERNRGSKERTIDIKWWIVLFISIATSLLSSISVIVSGFLKH